MSDGTFVYDEDCGFCTWLADYFGQRTTLELVGFEALTDEQRQRLPADYEECSHLLTDEEVYSCGESIEEALLRSEVGGEAREAVEVMRGFEEYERLRELAYRAVADRRDVLGQFISSDPPARSKE